MSLAAVLAIVVAVGEAESTTSVALMAAARESVGTATTIRIVEVPAPNRAAGLLIERELGAGSVVVLSWREPAHLHAVLLHHVVTTDRWTVRRMSFVPADALHERGRTLGLAVASMSPEIWRPAPPLPAGPGPGLARDRVPRPPPPTSPPAPLASGARPTGPTETTRVPPRPVVTPVASAQDRDGPNEAPKEARTAARREYRSEDRSKDVRKDEPEDPVRVEPAAAVTRAADAPPIARRGTPEPATIPAPRSRTFALGLAAIGASGIGGPPQALGGMLEGVWYVRRRLALRVGLGLRRGDVPGLPAGRDLAASAAIGLEWWVLGGARDEGFGVGLRLDALALHHSTTATFPEMSGARFPDSSSETLPGADALVVAYLGVGRRLDLLAGAGLEAVSGATDINFYLPDVRDPRVVATIPPFRAVGFAGMRIAW